MYYPKLSAETDPVAIDALIREHGFATLVTGTSDGPVASHVPLELVRDPAGTRVLEGHLARANPHWQLFAAGERTLAIFSGPHTYISPTWYGHENVPTWNYLVVHAWGVPRLVEDELAVRQMLRRLAQHYEPEGSGGFDVDRLTPGFYAREVRGIVAFTMPVERLEAKFKLSQNRDAADHANIVRQLLKRADDDSRAVAARMAERRPNA